MNTQNTLYAIDRDLNALYHEGHKGQRKGVHQFGRWQRNTVYANGRPDPNAKPREKNASDSGKKEGALTRAKNAVIGAKARFDAKNDAAIRAMRTVGDDTKGADRFNRLTKAAGLTGAVAGGLAGGAIGSAIGSKLPGNQKLQNRLAVSNYAKPSSKYGVANYAKPERLVNPLPFAWRANKYGVSSRGQRPSYIDAAPDSVKGALSKAVGFMPSRRVVGGYIGGRIGAVAGGTIGYTAASAALYKGYAKRGAGSLKGAKVSPAYEKAYKSKFNDYYKKYSQKGMKAEYEEILAKRGQHTYRMWQPQSAYAGMTYSDAKRLSGADFDGDRVPRVSGRYVYGS